VAAVLVFAGALLYYYLHTPGEAGPAVESRSARTSVLDPAVSAKPLRRPSDVAIEALPAGAQSHVTHTLSRESAPSDSQSIVRTQDPVQASTPVRNVPTASSLTPAANRNAPRVTHTQPIASTPASTVEKPELVAPTGAEVKRADCGAPAAVLGLCEPLRSSERK